MKEVWKRPKNFPLYEVSSQGRIRRYDNKKLRKLILCPEGYVKLRLHNKNGKAQNIRAHRLIAQTFFGDKGPLKVVNHKNGIKSDNRTENLEWVSSGQNQKHAYDRGFRKKGEQHWKNKLSENCVREIKILFSQGTTISRIAKKFEIGMSTAYAIKTGRTWSHVHGIG